MTTSHPSTHTPYPAHRDPWQGRIVYQIFVDRFHRSSASGPLAPSTPGTEVRGVPRRLRAWDETPSAGHYLPEHDVWSHEIDFWGGDLKGITEKLDDLAHLGIEVLYLTPIFESVTNHRYDTCDYFKIDPLAGTEEDLRELCQEAHARKIRVVLDGVFNHTGKRSDWLDRPHFFERSPQFKNGYRAWKGVANLPELALEHPDVKQAVYAAPDSVVQHYLKLGLDGWRLDVAHDLGPAILRELTAAAHTARRDSIVIGETWNYPAVWISPQRPPRPSLPDTAPHTQGTRGPALDPASHPADAIPLAPAMDATIHFFFRDLILSLLNGTLSARQLAAAVGQAIADCGIDAIPRSWIVLDNHDTARLPKLLPDERLRRLARTLQFTLPGCPQLYYGNEVDLSGGHDPENRAPMPWDRLTSKSNPFLTQLIRIYRENPALRWGDCRFHIAERLVAFTRGIEKFEDMRIVLANPTAQMVDETVVIPDYRISHHAWTEDVLTGEKQQFLTASLRIQLEPYQVRILKPLMNTGEYFPYRRL